MIWPHVFPKSLKIQFVLQGLQEVVRGRRSEVKEFMYTAACGCFEFALEFKLFAIGVSISSAPLRLASLFFQFSYGTASVFEGFA